MTNDIVTHPNGEKTEDEGNPAKPPHPSLLDMDSGGFIGLRATEIVEDIHADSPKVESQSHSRRHGVALNGSETDKENTECKKRAREKVQFLESELGNRIVGHREKYYAHLSSDFPHLCFLTEMLCLMQLS